MILIISSISILLTFFYVLSIASFIRGWLHLKPSGQQAFLPETSICIIIAARNEEDTIGSCLQDILKQDYPLHLIEIIVVDDHSADNTAAIVTGMAHPAIRLIKLHEEKPINSYKKKAIATAIGSTNQELIITTDADCRMGSKWLSAIARFYQANNVKVISAPVAYHQEKNLFERIQTLEFSYLIGIGGASIGNKKPNTCNGANFAYTKDVFKEVGGFKGIDDLASGDDELLLQKVSLKYPGQIGFLLDRDAIVYTSAKPGLHEFIQQRKRWASKSVKYKNKLVVLLAMMFFFFNLSLVLNAALSFLFPQLIYILLLQLLLKIFMDAWMLWLVTGFFKRRGLIVNLLLLELCHIVYVIFIGVYSNMGNYQWKGRSVK